MQKTFRKVGLWCVALAALAALAYGQDAPSLGDAARQARLHKQQLNDAQKKSGQSARKPKVITDEDVIHSQLDEVPPASSGDQAPQATSASPDSGASKLSAGEWRSKIQAQQDAVNSLQDDIDKLNQSIQFAPGNCVAGCVPWNEHQKEKQQEVERMRGQLQEQQKRLADMQEAARQQGYGSAITDP
jgi:hypothetical protein